ncbi:uncharacterized protein TM35_000361420 [Trypanosoma theileri]|uniref:Uncharacterized protein n=1 Tax=Trypanosoma theileri TaxID=67003 RepID=A0A1X0NKK1_9TRYP|nr:uncharacterized protein TM35_000361420 [Trypanosoma theileri]ORC85282.1 hypothetical protein TM35_000361420 [Trypanosoma theileri]
MEDDVVHSRCTAIIQQLLSSDAQQPIHQKHHRIITTAAEALRQRAMLLYRLCRAKQEKLAENQTEDAAYCVLAAVSSCQPDMWSVLCNWSRGLRPRMPELRFGAPAPMTVKLKEVEHFIARTSYLQPVVHTENHTLPISSGGGGTGTGTGGNTRVSTCLIGTPNGTRKHPRDDENMNGSKLEMELVVQLVFSYFQLNVPNVKKLHAVVSAYEKEMGGIKVLPNVEENISKRPLGSSGRRSGVNTIAGTHGESNSNNTGALLPEEDDLDDDIMDTHSMTLPLDTSSLCSSSTFGFPSVSSVVPLQYFALPMGLKALADSIDSARSVLFYDRLQRCLRNPLLYSPLSCMNEANASFTDIMSESPIDEVEEAYLYFCHNAFGDSDGSLQSPTHFLHPSRARLQSLMPLPLQLVTAQQLWTRLLVAGLWLQVCNTESDHSTYNTILNYCTMIVKAGENDPYCAVCEGLVREKPALRLSALTQGEDNSIHMDNVYSWEEIKQKSILPSVVEESICDEVLRGLTIQLCRKAVIEAEKDTLTQIQNTTTSMTPKRRSDRTSLSSLFPTLRELLLEVQGSYPLAACRAALIGGSSGETYLNDLLKSEHTNKKIHDKGCVNGPSRETRLVRELMDTVPRIPRLREVDAVLECASCLLLFHQDCVCPVQRDASGGIFLCHACRLARSSWLLPPLNSTTTTVDNV